MRQNTDFTAIDTIAIPPATPLISTPIFSNGIKHAAFNTLKLPIPPGTTYKFTHLLFSHQLIFRLMTEAADRAAGDPRLALEAYWAEFSMLQIKISNVEYPLIPISSLLPYRIVRTRNGYEHRDKQVQNYQLADPIQVSEGSIEFNLLHAPSLMSASAALADTLPPELIGGNVAGPTYWFKLSARSISDRPIGTLPGQM